MHFLEKVQIHTLPYHSISYRTNYMNIYYCLGPYYKYFSSYSTLKSSVYQLNRNMHIKGIFLG